MRNASIQASGVCFCGAAVTTLTLNLFVSPHLPTGAFSVIAASSTYLLRQIIAATVAMMLVFGLIGVRDSRMAGDGRFAVIAVTLALAGQMLLFAIEFGQAFIVHDYALHAPAALDDAMTELHRPLAIGALIAIVPFYAGWLLLAVALLRARRISRLCAGLLLAGFLATPALSTIKALGVLGGIIASLIIGAGWLMLGLQMIGVIRTSS